MKNINSLFKDKNATKLLEEKFMWDVVKSFISIRNSDGKVSLTVIRLDSDDVDVNDFVWVLDHDSHRFYQATFGEWQELLSRRQTG